MAESRVYPESPPESLLAPGIRAILQSEPGVGFSIVDGAGVVRFLNDRAAEIFLETGPENMVGRSLPDLYGPEWAAERMAAFERIRETGKPVIMRHIRNGRQVQSTVRMISEPDDEEDVFLVITTAGEHEPETPDEFEIMESGLAHFGALDALTRRELEVLALIGHGMTTLQIAAALHRSPRTIERHCDRLREKLRAANRVKLAAFARDAGLRLEDANLKRV